MHILFDIGGTKTRVAATADLKEFGEPIKFDTPKNFEEGIEEIKKAAEKLANGKKIARAAGAIRGPLSADRRSIVSDDVLTDWVLKPICDSLEEAFDAKVEIENDAALAALGEAHHGAGKGYAIVAYHTVSTGVGGARVVNGKIDASQAGFEPGHQIIDADKTLLDPSEADTLEELISGTAMERRFGVKPYEVPQSDPVWDELARWLSYGLKNTIVYWSPDVIVLGGSMIVGDPRILLADIVRHTEEALDGFVLCPPIKDAAFRDNGALYGALTLLSKKK